MYLHSLCAWSGSLVRLALQRQAATEAAATETSKGTPIALFMSFSCGHTSRTHESSSTGCHTAQPFVYHAMQMLTLSIVYWPIDTVLSLLACLQVMHFCEAQADIPVGECPVFAS